MGYARIWKDRNGKPSGYRECDGEVAFMPKQQSYENIFRRVKIDTDTFCVLSNKYAKDDKHVYYECAVLKKAKPETFVVLDSFYARDDRHVYCGNRIFEADAKTFAVLQDGYAKDCNHLFLRGFIEKEDNC